MQKVLEALAVYSFPTREPGIYPGAICCLAEEMQLKLTAGNRVLGHKKPEDSGLSVICKEARGLLGK